MNSFAVASARELSDFLRASAGPVRVCGSGSRQERSAPIPAAASVVTLRGLSQIERFEPADLTCSVQAGVERTALDEVLATRGVELGCAGGGTLGGLFAADPIGAQAPGGPTPRSLLLGLDAVLADGTPFKSGARVVKSVAGFDVHKLFVGSRGTLFAATTLHLKLQPRPRARTDFARCGLDQEAALGLFDRLRLLAVPPRRLALQRGHDGFAVRGQFAGRAGFVHAMLRAHELPEAREPWLDHVEMPAAGEVFVGSVPPSRLPELLRRLPATTQLLVRGGGRFEVAVTTALSDLLLMELPQLDGYGAIAAGAAERRGRATTLDPGAARLQSGLARALDPKGVFA